MAPPISARQPPRLRCLSTPPVRHLDVIGPEAAPAEHVVDAAGCADNDVNACAQDARILADAGSADAGVALDLQVVAEGAHDLLDLLRKLAGGRQHKSLAVGEGVVDVVKDAWGGVNGEGGWGS